MSESILRDLAKELAVKIFNICDKLEQKGCKGVFINQIVRSSSSIGANVHEANYASSKADFINKLHIAAKECFETEYWIELMHATNCINQDTNNELINKVGLIRRMLAKSINTAKCNLAKQKEERKKQKLSRKGESKASR